MAASGTDRPRIQLNDFIMMLLSDPERHFGTRDPEVISNKLGEGVLDENPTDDVGELQGRIAELQLELLKASADRAVQNMVVKNAQYRSAAVNQMFSTPLPNPNGDKENMIPSSDASESSRREYEAVLQEHSELSAAYLKKMEAVEKLEKQIEAIRKENFELKKRNRELMNNISQHRKDLEKADEEVQRSAACRGLKEELEGRLARIEIIKNTLQGLIIGSGVNWAQDPELLDTVLRCGDTPD